MRNIQRLRKYGNLVIFLFLFLSLLIPSNIFFSETKINQSQLSHAFPTSGLSYTVDLSIQQAPNVLRYLESYPLNPFTFDSIAHYTSGLNSLIFDTLVIYDISSDELLPSLATQWVVTNDSLRWIFSLRRDVLFHDGSEFNANSVKFTYDRLIDPSHPAFVPDPYPELLEFPIESVEILGEYQLAFNFYEPYPAFTHLEASYIDIISSKSFQGSDITTPIGTGPYIYQLSSSNTSYHNLTRNNAYFRGFPPFETIDFYTFESLSEVELAIEEAIENRDVDFIPKSLPDQLDSNDTYWQQANSDFLTRIDLIWFNHQQSQLSDERVRQAINYAVDKNAYLDELSIEGFPLTSIIPHNMIFHDEDIQGFSYNVSKANELLDEAGYLRGTDGYRFDLDLVSSYYAVDRADLLSSFLDSIGIRCNLNATSEWLNKWFAGDYDLMNFGWVGIIDPSILTRIFLQTSGSANTGGYSNVEMDKFIVLGQTTPVQQEREYYYKQVQQLAQEDAPYVLLTEATVEYLKSSLVAPFIFMTKNGRIGLNYANNLPSPLFKIQNTMEMKPNHNIEFRHTNITISDKPIYFPFTDSLIESINQQPLNVNISMSYNLNTFISTQNETGKFFELEVDNSKVEFTFRAYYDFEELGNQSITNELGFYGWDEQKNQWIQLEIAGSDSSLRYVEVNLNGEYKLFRLAEFVAELTFQYLPGMALATLIMITIAVVRIWQNTKYTKYLKRELDLI